MTNQSPQPSNYGGQPIPDPPKKHTVRNIVLSIVGGLIALAVIGSFIPDEDTSSAASDTKPDTTSAVVTSGDAPEKTGEARQAREKRQDAREERREEARQEAREERQEQREQAAEETAEEGAEEEAEANGPTVEQENALSSAQSYLDLQGFSASGLVKQLEFEGYPTTDAQWAVDNSGADWNAEAAESAQDYQDLTPMSRQGLIDQLTFEGFTAEQAAYGASQVGL